MTPSKNIKKPTCLQIIPSLGIGGVETGVRNIAKYLNNKNIRNYILCESSDRNLESKNLNIIYLNNLKFKNILDQIKIKNVLRKLIIEKKINLIHISSRAPAFYLINFLKKLNVRIVTSVHNRHKSENFLKIWYNSFLLKSDYVIFNSKFVQNSFNKSVLANLKSTVICRGVDINYFQSKKFIKIRDKNYFFMPSRISNWKGHELLLCYFSQLSKNYKDKYKLLFISSHKTNEEIKIDTIIKKKNLNNYVEFADPTLDIKKLYEKSFLIINISRRPEGFGRTVSESLSMSRPVIAPDIGGTKEQLEFFDSNLLFDVNSFNSFKKTLEYAINNHEEISEKARTYVKKNFSARIMCENTLKIYNTLVS